MIITTSIKDTSSKDSMEMISSFMTAHPQGSITTIARDGVLQSSVVNILETSEFHYTFMTKKETRKYINIHNNPTVSFITYDPFSRTETEIEGIAVLVTDQKEQDEIVVKIRADAELGRWHISPYVNEFDDYILFTIYPRRIHQTTFWEQDSGIEAYQESIDFDVKMSS